MKYDAGALAEFPEKSSIFRFLKNNPPRIYTWPKNILKEICVFISTPGISEYWCRRNFGFYGNRYTSIRLYAKPYEHLGFENMLTATEEDAIRYLKRRRRGELIPIWAKPFILDDIKAGIRQFEVVKKYGISRRSCFSMRKGKGVDNVFHSGNIPRRRNNLGR